jgi:translation elongation factor EF-Tu-like GTPase
VAGDDHTGPVDVLPDGAVLLLTAEHVMRPNVTVLCGRIECEEVRIGDRVVAVAVGPICKGVVSGLERFAEDLAVARCGDEVGVVVRGWREFPLAPGVRLFRVPEQRHAEPVAAADGGGR